ncbi:MAG: maltose alpha-D-glucosyltransferase [Actinomycetaceae bacterium]|nr:maltose alpha-D-glucosyltransferase [Actinomycetaceae bacterium]MDY6082785.1 maltose alpha-D-glucosyltransferase [Actinomycetaceae bacterium]
MTEDPLWYQHAVFYEVLLRSFGDANGDGMGDLAGLTAHLDYLQWLGVDCLWLPPFYPSPMQDGGYDISNFMDINPIYGSLDDFRTLVEGVHNRGMRILVDIPLNHTSDQHPWFQSSRSNPSGPYGDYYVWRDDDSGYPDARVIFVDSETSNWTFDPVRKQYFWHRFFSSQPDLNYENPDVQREILTIIRFWAGFGVDGFRLDAVPYLFEEEGTNGENLPKTHEFIARIRQMIDAEFPGTILLAEANQWPEDVVEYFGTEERPECHMCFHFPVMPRIFYSLKEGNAQAIRSILMTTPDIPTTAQWSTFLRNHDELTLEMVTDQERAQMYSWYATDQRMRANVGIRRRLAPLLDNSLTQIQLANILLFSLPGSPYVYYGDEIGMGDNIWLPDRDGVRTPMQWIPEANAGFSQAAPADLNLPVISSLSYNPSAVNVQSQLEQPHSLLHWMRNTLAVRKAHPVFGDGALVLLPTDNPAVLAFVRHNAEETILCAMNIADSAQATTVDVDGCAGSSVTDLFSGSVFPSIAEDGSLRLTFAARGYYWFSLSH